MTFTGPWFIDGGVKQHPARLARMMMYASTYGAEGVLGPLDLRGRQLVTSGAGIRLAPGGVVIPNRAAGGAYESYSDKTDTEIEVPITPTDASGGRSDLVICRVENPHEAGGGWTAPTDPATDSYTHPRVIENVSPSLTDVHDHNALWSAATILRVDIPEANTATITDDMITDLRSIAKLGAGRVVGVIAQDFAHETAVGTGLWNTGAPALDPADTTFQNWPPSASWTIPVPEWATHVTASCSVGNAHLIGGDAWGEMRLVIDGAAQPPVGMDLNQDETANAGGFRAHVGVAGTYVIDPVLRGGLANFHLETRAYSDARVTGTLYADVATFCELRVTFKQLPVYA